MRYFLSHTSSDKAVVRGVGVELQVVGADVFFDEWSIGAGESIPGAIEIALRDYETFLLFWSAAAQKSAWTKREYRSAVTSFIEDEGRKLIVLRLDDAELPPLVRDLKWIDLRNESTGDAVKQIVGFKGEPERLRAIQNFLEERSVDVEYFPGYGAAVGCPSCGAAVIDLEGWSEWDNNRDDLYAGARCKICGWNDGGEIMT